MDFVIKTLSEAIKITGIVNVHFFEFPENYYTKTDSHPFYELVYVSRGVLEIKSDDYDGDLGKDKLIVHRPSENHSLSCKGGRAPTVIIIGFTCKGGGLDALSRSPVSLSGDDAKKLAEIVKEARKVFSPPYDVPVLDMKKKKNPPFGAEQLLEILLEYFLIGLLRKTRRGGSREKNRENDKLNVDEIIAYIGENFLEKITIDEMAFLFCTNRSTLCKQFKNATGKTINGYINDLKLQSAKQRILSTDETFTEIAEDMNFESIHYFTRFFKNASGMTPKDYRRLYKKKTD